MAQSNGMIAAVDDCPRALPRKRPFSYQIGAFTNSLGEANANGTSGMETARMPFGGFDGIVFCKCREWQYFGDFGGHNWSGKEGA